MVIDTDVLIDYFRGYQSAAGKIAKVDNLIVSIVTVFELYQGARDRKEIDTIRKMLKEWEFKIIPLDEEQSYQTLFLMEKYSLSYGLKMADAMIAASGIVNRQELLTGNYNNYKFISGLTVKKYTHRKN